MYNVRGPVLFRAPPAVKGMFLNRGDIGCVLFDTAASHSFVRNIFSHGTGLADASSNIIMTVDSPLGSRAFIRSICKGVGVNIGRSCLVADLLILEM